MLIAYFVLLALVFLISHIVVHQWNAICGIVVFWQVLLQIKALSFSGKHLKDVIFVLIVLVEMG